MERSTVRRRPTGFAVCPHDAVAAAYAWWVFCERLNARFSLGLLFHSFEQFPPFEMALDRGEFAVAYLNPFHYARARDNQDYVAIARPSNSLEIARLVALRTRASGMVAAGTVACVDVHMTTIALQGPRARGVQLAPIFVESYEAVLEAVRRGDAPYGLVYGNYLGSSLTEDGPLQITLAHVVHLPHVLAVHPTLASHVPDLQRFFFNSLDAFRWTLDLGIDGWELVAEAEYVASRSDATLIDTVEAVSGER